MDIPKRTSFNYIDTEAFAWYLKDTYKLSDKVIDEILDFASSCIETSIDTERAAWLGKYVLWMMEQRKHGSMV